MASSTSIKIGFTGFIAAGFLVAAYRLQPESPPGMEQPFLWYSIVPPLVAISLAILTGRIMISLGVAVLTGGLLNTLPGNFFSLSAWGQGVDTGMSFVGSSLGDTWNMQLLAFIVLALTMISVVIISGGLHGIVLWLSQFAKGPRSAQFITYLLGLMIFIDDYANTMIVGTAMRPVTDKLKVSREKLAFIVDSTSAPIAGLAVISTWVGYEVSQINGAAATLGIEKNGYAILFDALPYRFYCILMLAFVFMNIVSGKDFGPMRRAQLRTHATGKVAEPDAVPMTSDTYSKSEHDPSARILAITGLIPIGMLFALLLGGIWLDGGGAAQLSESPLRLFSFSAWREVIGASENSVKILAYGAGISLGAAVICARLLGGLSMEIIGKAVRAGLLSSMLPVLILILAWSLKASCDSLNTGSFMVAIVGDSISPVLFPALIFIIAGLTSFATGTSYGTMAILMPTAVPIAFALEGGTYGLITIITIGSILDGAIFGDHCSPISDTTIMSSIASSTDHLHHVRTQLPYSLFVAALALLCGYLPAGLGSPAWASYAIAAGGMAGLYAVLPKKFSEVSISETRETYHEQT